MRCEFGSFNVDCLRRRMFGGGLSLKENFGSKRVLKSYAGDPPSVAEGSGSIAKGGLRSIISPKYGALRIV